MAELMQKTLIVVPTYNEAANARELLEGIFRFLPQVHVLVVDDGSPDGTAAIVRGLAQETNRPVSVLERSGKLGLGTAYVAGFKWGLERGFEQLIEMDADLSHDPKYLPAMVKALQQADVAVGSRYVPGGGTVNWGMIRKFISRGGSLYARIVLGKNVQDFTGGFNGWHRRVLTAIDLDTVRSEGYSFQVELKYRALLAQFTVKEFPIIFRDRQVGQSKMSGSIVREAMWRVLLLRFGIGIKKTASVLTPGPVPGNR